MSDLAANVKEQLDEGAGYWHSCSGCHESIDGHSVTPTDPIFRCATGSGCHECGGIGVVWDNTDYEKFADFCVEEDRKEGEIKRLRTALQAIADDKAVPPWIQTLAQGTLGWKTETSAAPSDAVSGNTRESPGN